MENVNNVNSASKSNLILNNRNALNITGIKKVKTTEPAKIVAVLDNCIITINGQNLSVQNLNIDSGIMDILGLVHSISYSNAVKRKFSFRNMFK